MTGRAVREWFTPGVIINLIGVAVAAILAWAGVTAHIDAQGKDIDRQGKAIERIESKMPNTDVINLRLGTMEEKIHNLDPVLLVGIKADIEFLKHESIRQSTKIDLNQDYMEGRIFDFPYRVPAKRHRGVL